MNFNMQKKWEHLHCQSRFRPKYPNELVVQFIFKNFKRDGNSKILDIGCGAGRHVYFMANENINAYGIDISRDGIDYTNKILKQDGLKANLEISSVEEIPFEDSFFDGLICYGVLYYCKNEQITKAIKDMHRVLKFNGKGLLVVRNKKDYRYGKGVEIEKSTFLINEEDCNKQSFNENGMIMHFFEKQELENLFKDFKKVEIDEIIETYENGKRCDCNFIVKFEK